jgi:hypothetical protein
LDREYSWWMRGGEDGSAVTVGGREYRRGGGEHGGGTAGGAGGGGSPLGANAPLPAILNRYVVSACGPRPESMREDEALAGKREGAARVGLFRELAAGAASGWDYSTRWEGRGGRGVGGVGDKEGAEGGGKGRGADGAADVTGAEGRPTEGAATPCLLFDLGSIRTSQIVPVELNAILYANEVRRGCLTPPEPSPHPPMRALALPSPPLPPSYMRQPTSPLPSSTSSILRSLSSACYDALHLTVSSNLALHSLAPQASLSRMHSLPLFLPPCFIEAFLSFVLSGLSLPDACSPARRPRRHRGRSSLRAPPPRQASPHARLLLPLSLFFSPSGRCRPRPHPLLFPLHRRCDLERFLRPRRRRPPLGHPEVDVGTK